MLKYDLKYIEHKHDKAVLKALESRKKTLTQLSKELKVNIETIRHTLIHLKFHNLINRGTDKKWQLIEK